MPSVLVIYTQQFNHRKSPAILQVFLLKKFRLLADGNAVRGVIFGLAIFRRQIVVNPDMNPFKSSRFPAVGNHPLRELPLAAAYGFTVFRDRPHPIGSVLAFFPALFNKPPIPEFLEIRPLCRSQF